MLEIGMDIDDRVTALLNAFPKFAKRAEASALKSAGNKLRGKMRRFIETGGEDWPPIGEYTKLTRKSKGGPLYFLGRFIRYRFSRRGGEARVTLGVASTSAKTRAKMKAALGGARREIVTPLLMFRKAERGKTYRVTARMRRHMAAMGMPIRKETRRLVVPKRPIFEPVWRREKDGMAEFVQKRFINAMLRYATGGVLGKKE